MLNENIKNIRKSKGLSQEEFAVKLNVVRQTVSKWERGLSVPDSDLLIAISETLDTPVSVLLGETVPETPTEDVKALAEKLEVVNLQLARKKERNRRLLRWALILFCVLLAGGFLLIWLMGSPYLGWDLSDPELAVAGVIWHAFEFIFVRAAPLFFLAAIAGICLTFRRK